MMDPTWMRRSLLGPRPATSLASNPALMLGSMLALLFGCEDRRALDRKLSSFEVTLLSPVGAPDRRCLLPGTPTTGADLSGCPIYTHDAAGLTVARVEFEARAIDNSGDLLEDYSQLASVRVVPGNVEPAFKEVRFTGGRASAVVSFRGSFDDTVVWIVDDKPPPRDPEVPGFGSLCGASKSEVDLCSSVGLTCVDTAATNVFDPDGLAYCSRACDPNAAPGESGCARGYRCTLGFDAYPESRESSMEGACARTQPSYASGASAPIHLIKPTLSDVSRSESFLTSPFEGEFIEIKNGNLIVTAIRIDGFYVTDTLGTEFNHLYVFNYSRPDDLLAGDRLISVAGPMSEFFGLTEMNFPLWEVDYAAGAQPIPKTVDLHERVIDRFPRLVDAGGSCSRAGAAPEDILLVDCDQAMERLEAARVSIRVARTSPIDAMDLERFGQWPVVVDMARRERTFQIITRDNIPFFDPKLLTPRTELKTITGNLRQFVRDERDEPVWILEPRDQADCPRCVNP